MARRAEVPRVLGIQSAPAAEAVTMLDEAEDADDDPVEDEFEYAGTVELVRDTVPFVAEDPPNFAASAKMQHDHVRGK